MKSANIDNSYENSIKHKTFIFLKTLKKKGILKTVKKVMKQLYYKVTGVDFSSQTLDGLTIAGQNKAFGTTYGSGGEDFLIELLEFLKSIDPDILNGSFNDFGSGKGRALVVAKEFGFKSCVGVEFAEELCEVSLNNVKKLGLNDIKVYHDDVVNHIPDTESSVIYFYNPFSEIIMNMVLKNIVDNSINYKNNLYIVYALPNYPKALKKNVHFSLIKRYESDGLAEIYKLI